MKFSPDQSIEILERTPNTISAFLSGLSEEWTTSNEGGNTWTVKEVVAHLVVCEETNWLPRVRVILSESASKIFAPIDMTAHFAMAKDYSLQDLLSRFRRLRESAIEEIKTLKLQDRDFLRTAHHPVIGIVSLQQLIAAWTTHDLSHIAQMARVMAKQNRDLVGGFQRYLTILN